jgi:hypothetical protein
MTLNSKHLLVLLYDSLRDQKFCAVTGLHPFTLSVVTRIYIRCKTGMGANHYATGFCYCLVYSAVLSYLYIHSPIHLHGTVLNWLSIGATLPLSSQSGKNDMKGRSGRI